MTSETVYVFVKTKQDKPAVLVGRLQFFGGHVEFKYSKKWLDSPDRFSFHPELLPLLDMTFSNKSLEGALSVFRDSGPGIWGKEVIKRIRPGATAADMMVLSNNLLGIGTFRFSKNQLAVENDSFINTDLGSIDEIYQAIIKIENGLDLTEKEKILVAQGSSMDGMRPKAFCQIDGHSWIVKFPSKNDLDNKAFNEMLGMQLARECGLNVPKTKLIRLMDRKLAIAVKRYDTEGDVIFPVMSAASLMGFSNTQTDKKDYRVFAQSLTRFSPAPYDDCESLFKRMCLNILISNRDDHIFNQGMLGSLNKNAVSWRLAPVYDVVCGESNARGHAMQIGTMGFVGNLANAITSVGSFGLDQPTARTIFAYMVDVLSRWRELVPDMEQEAGVPLESETKNIAWAINNKEIFKDYPLANL